MAWLYPPTERKKQVAAFFVVYLACSLAVTVCLGLEMQSGLEYIDKYISLAAQDIQKYGEEKSPFGLWGGGYFFKVGCNLSLRNSYSVCTEAVQQGNRACLLFLLFLILHICVIIILYCLGAISMGWVLISTGLGDVLFIGLAIYNITFTYSVKEKMRAVLNLSNTTPVSALPDFHPALSWQALLIVLFSGIAAKIIMHGYFAFMHARQNRATSRQYELV